MGVSVYNGQKKHMIHPNPFSLILEFLGLVDSFSIVTTWLNFLLTQAGQDYRFPGSGRALGSGQSETVPAVNSDSNLQARLLDNSNPNRSSHLGVTATREPPLDGR